MPIFCPNCGREVPVGRPNCPACGKPVSTRDSRPTTTRGSPQPSYGKNCSRCGTKMPLDADVCPKCGLRVTPESQS